MSWRKDAKKFMAGLCTGGKIRNLGYYSTPEAAFAAYKQAKEAEIRRVAALYRPDLDPRVYEALMTYTVDVND